MFDIFNKKKIKELEGDIQTLYTLYENQQRDIKCGEVFDSFCSNRYLNPHSNGQIVEQVESEFVDIATRTVVGMILDKMGLWLKYKPAKKEVVKETPSEFELRSVN